MFSFGGARPILSKPGKKGSHHNHYREIIDSRLHPAVLHSQLNIVVV